MNFFSKSAFRFTYAEIRERSSVGRLIGPVVIFCFKHPYLQTQFLFNIFTDCLVYYNNFQPSCYYVIWGGDNGSQCLSGVARVGSRAPGRRP